MNMPDVTFRNWEIKDFPQVISLLMKTWSAAYSSFIPQEDLDSYLGQTYSLEKLSELYNNKNVICFLVEVNDKVAGWLKLIINETENRFYLSSLYVLPEYQKLKIGKELIDISFKTAKDFGFNEIWIGVMENNTKAFEWYRKLGFEFIKELPFTMGKTTVNHLIGVKKLV